MFNNHLLPQEQFTLKLFYPNITINLSIPTHQSTLTHLLLQDPSFPKVMLQEQATNQEAINHNEKINTLYKIVNKKKKT